MNDPIYDIISSIEKTIAARFTGKYYGVCELVNGQAERYPVTVATKRDRVNPADTWQLQIYHRLLAALRVPDEEFGRNVVLDQVVRMVIIANVNLGETLPLKIIKELPRKAIVPNGAGMLTDVMNVDRDHETIATTEFGAMPEDKHRLVKNLFVIEYTLRLQLCEPLTINP
jgi:hypothetical protein